MQRRGIITLCLFALLGLSACSPFEKDGPIPSYIRIGEFTVDTKADNSQGSGAHGIEDAWVYVDNELIGVFEVPITIPIVQTGVHKITIFAGIKKNGLANTRITYPFYNAFIDTLDLVAEQIIDVSPVVKYYDGIKFSLLEDFEDNSISFTKSGSDVTHDSMYVTHDPTLVFEYNGGSNKASGAVDIPLGRQIFQNASIASYDLPRADDVYLELNYKSDLALQTGIIAMNTSTAVPVLYLFPTEGEWKKAYISLAEDVNSTQYEGSEFKIFFDAVSSTDTNVIHHIYFDNIKIVHR